MDLGILLRQGKRTTKCRDVEASEARGEGQRVGLSSTRGSIGMPGKS